MVLLVESGPVPCHLSKGTGVFDQKFSSVFGSEGIFALEPVALAHFWSFYTIFSCFWGFGVDFFGHFKPFLKFFILGAFLPIFCHLCHLSFWRFLTILCCLVGCGVWLADVGMWGGRHWGGCGMLECGIGAAVAEVDGSKSTKRNQK